MNQHTPPHPGEFLELTYLKPLNLSGRTLARHIKVAPSTLGRLINQQSAVTPEMAVRLGKALGRSPESWLAMQSAYDLWVAKKNIKVGAIKKIRLDGLVDCGI